MVNGSIAAAMYPSYPRRDLVRTIQQHRRAPGFRRESEARSRRSAKRPWNAGSCSPATAEGALTLDELRDMGRCAMERDPGLLARITGEVRPADAAILYLTSGATGEPKMALVSHGALSLPISTWARRCSRRRPEDATVAFLPSAHIAQRVVIELLPAAHRHAGHFRRKPAQAAAGHQGGAAHHPAGAAAHVGAHSIPPCARKSASARRPFARPSTARWGWALPRRATAAPGKPVPARIRGPLKLADLLFFRKIRSRFGGRLRVAASGAAPLGKELAEFYEAIGMPLVEGYGLTEGGVVVAQSASTVRAPAASASRFPASRCASPRTANCSSRAPPS